MPKGQRVGDVGGRDRLRPLSLVEDESLGLSTLVLGDDIR